MEARTLEPFGPSLPAVGLFVILFAVACCSGCRREHRSTCPVFTFQIRDDTTQPTVAEVDGHPISKRELIRHIEETGLNPRQALDDLVECKLLELEARRLGLDRDPEVLAAAKSAAARLLVKRVFEPAHTKDKVPESALRKSYELNIKRFVHPELRRFSHVLVVLPWKRRRRKFVIYRDEILRAKALAEEFHTVAVKEAARRKLTWRDFEALASAIRNRGFEIRVERGTKARTDLVEPFADALFSLKGPGAISPVVRTRWGFHVIFLVEVIPAKHTSFEEARGQVLEHVYPELRRDWFKKWLESLEEHCPVEVHPERLPIAGVCFGGRKEALGGE